MQGLCELETIGFWNCLRPNSHMTWGQNSFGKPKQQTIINHQSLSFFFFFFKSHFPPKPGVFSGTQKIKKQQQRWPLHRAPLGLNIGGSVRWTAWGRQKRWSWNSPWERRTDGVKGGWWSQEVLSFKEKGKKTTKDLKQWERTKNTY